MTPPRKSMKRPPKASIDPDLAKHAAYIDCTPYLERRYATQGPRQGSAYLECQLCGSTQPLLDPPQDIPALMERRLTWDELLEMVNWALADHPENQEVL